RRLYRLNIQIDYYWLLTASRDNTAKLLIFTRIDLLMRHERWNIDKVARSCFRNEFEMLPPAHPCPTPHYVNDTLQFAMMVGACLGVGFDREGACPQFASAGPCIGNGSRARHTGCLRSIEIKLTCWNHLHSMVAPMCSWLHTHIDSPLCACLDECLPPPAHPPRPKRNLTCTLQTAIRPRSNTIKLAIVPVVGTLRLRFATLRANGAGGKSSSIFRSC